MSWLKKNKKLVLILLIILGVYSVYKYMYKPPISIEVAAVSFTGNAMELLEKSNKDFRVWNQKIVEVKGIVTSKDVKGITLNEQVYCQLKNTNALLQIEKQQEIQIKGRVIGYDDLLEELKLNECILIK
ncbi:hypothetical protein [Tenacibaculum amylolyticum]|uniref:hypothetical protein n=1 Tax=Tenacibaculum amylolyticum TaxID=104269 RepID=UPI003894B2BF